MKFLLDTDTFSIAARDGSASLRRRLELQAPEDIALSAVTVGEIEFGLARHSPAPRTAARVAAMRSSFRVLALDEAAAVIYGRLRQALNSRGTPIGPNDFWIASHAIAAGLILVSGNTREFARVPGLMVENWLR